MQFSPIRGCFSQISKSKDHRFCQNYSFGTHFSCEKHPLHVFLLSPPPLQANFFQKKLSPNSWGVKKAPCKNLYLFGENWQRNQFPKLTNLLLNFHSWYNFAIVQCEKRKKRPEGHESGRRSGPINQKTVKFGTNGATQIWSYDFSFFVCWHKQI